MDTQKNQRSSRPKNITRTVITLLLGIALILVTPPLATHASAVNAHASAVPVPLTAHFRLFGEVQRFGLGYGDMDIHFGVDVPPGVTAPSIGRMEFSGAGDFHASGVLDSLNGVVPADGATNYEHWYVINTQFTYDFTLTPGDHSLYIGIGDNGLGDAQGGDKQTIFDFSDNIAYSGDVIGSTPDQGLLLESVTGADSSYQFAFNPANTLLTAAASAWDTQGSGMVYNTATPTDSGTRAAVFLTGATATSKLQGGFDVGSRRTDALADLDVSPETWPFVFDLAFATVSGNNNVTLTRTAPADSIAPTTTAARSPDPNAAGWNNSEVTVRLTATDNTGGSGVKATYYTVDDGAQQTYDSSKGIVIGTEGQYTIKYWSVDNAGNTETAQTLTVKLDKTPPTLSYGSADSQWHADNVSVGCTASDSGGSGLANSADASFSLTTNVPAGTETANAATDSRTVTDLAGNSATAGPIAGNKVDRKAPTITITTPSEGASYHYGDSYTANYSATDDGSGVKMVDGSVPNGGSLTGSVGKHDLSVTATDNVGNTATSPTVHYTVTYEWSGVLQPVNADDSSVFKSGSTVPVKFKLTGASQGISTAVVRLYVVKIDTKIDGTMLETVYTVAADSGNTFRYDSSSQQYIFNLSTKGLTTGTYQLRMYVGGDNTTGVLQGQVNISLK